MNTRLKQFLAAENISQAQFADNINVVRASVSHVLSGRNKPGFDFIQAMMAKYPRLNIEWLISGKGKMYKEEAARIPERESDLLFPEINADPEISDAPEIEEFAPRDNIMPDMPPMSGLRTSDNNMQNITNQRKVVKILVLFDDGTYQEM